MNFGKWFFFRSLNIKLNVYFDVRAMCISVCVCTNTTLCFVSGCVCIGEVCVLDHAQYKNIVNREWWMGDLSGHTSLHLKASIMQLVSLARLFFLICHFLFRFKYFIEY